ncbi:HEAT repeat domain-containing protein [Bradyrhizobium sp. dw_411]|uniref:HEAT repeat domain-containing protein n=1 Tax=Bradyrhizobium sp. dw_411 TaxID=2720082 RepID=UPI001BCEEBE5|nr:HEAT repeat domain-containing protein [Bradyrhizobium sp. dw_411]
MASDAFERFRFSFFEDQMSARDGLDTRALAELRGEEVTRAEDMLIGFLPDTRGVIGLGVLRSGRAEPQLTELFEAQQRAWREAKTRAQFADGEFHATDGLVYLAKALWRIRPDPRWRDAMIDVLGSAEDWQRQAAVEALCDVSDPVAVKALRKALDDAEPLVRYHAARGLLLIHGLPADFRDPAHMMYRAMSKDAARREGGKRDILAAIDGRSIGAL